MDEYTLLAFGDELQKIAAVGHKQWVTKILEAGRATKGDVLALADKLRRQGYPASQVSALKAAVRDAGPSGSLRGLM